jgi:hypothetical protein
MFNAPDEHNPTVYQRFTLKTRAFFPFENNSNWWNYTETAGNQMEIKVTDTISDDNVMYYRVSFSEHRVDTTDDWFRQVRGEIQFGTSLTGNYTTFMPSQLDSMTGSFVCGTQRVRYSYRDSMVIDGIAFKKILILRYPTPVIHGFEEITLAESIGIVQLKDYDGRWAVSYTIDSCSVDNIVREVW